MFEKFGKKFFTVIYNVACTKAACGNSDKTCKYKFYKGWRERGNATQINSSS